MTGKGGSRRRASRGDHHPQAPQQQRSRDAGRPLAGAGDRERREGDGARRRAGGLAGKAQSLLSQALCREFAVRRAALSRTFFGGGLEGVGKVLLHAVGDVFGFLPLQATGGRGGGAQRSPAVPPHPRPAGRRNPVRRRSGIPRDRAPPLRARPRPRPHRAPPNPGPDADHGGEKAPSMCSLIAPAKLGYPVPTRPDRQDPTGRIIAIKCLKIRRGSVAERRVWPLGVVVMAPSLDLLPDVGSEKNRYRLRRSWPSLPLRLSTKAFWTGFPGSMKRSRTQVRSDQSNMARLAPSGPLSRTISSGRPWINARSSRWRATRAPEIETSTSSLGTSGCGHRRCSAPGSACSRRTGR